MTGKGSNRRPTDEAAFAEGFDRIFGRKLIGKKLLGSSSTVEQATLTGSAAGSNPASPATFTFYEDSWEQQMEAAIAADPSTLDRLKAAFDDAKSSAVYVDDASGMIVDEDYWP